MSKTKFYLTITFTLLFAASVFAQQQFKHEARWYTSPDSTFYINWELPAYLRLATSPEANAPTHLLTSNTPKYSNPMYFEKGYNTIRSPWKIDPKTRKIVIPKEDVVFDIYADGDAPITRSTFTKAPKYYKSGVTYYGKGLMLKLTSKDALSGVEKTFISFNGEAYKEYSKEVEVNAEKEYSLKYYAADNVGNAAKSGEKKFTVDATAPKTAMEIEGDFKGNILSPRAFIVLKSTDALSGVKHTYYSVDGGRPMIYTKPISVRPLIDGDHTFMYYAIDNVKNNNAGDENVENPFANASKFGFVDDAKAPTTDIKIVGDYYKGKYEYVSTRSKVELSAEDKVSGVQEIRYGVDRTVNTVYSETFVIPNKKGTHTINFLAKDQVQNVSKTKTRFYYMDNATPTTGITYKYPQFFNRDTLFINKGTKIKLFAGDYESGVAKTEYSIDGGAFQAYSKEFVIPSEGYHTLKFRSTDRVNNVETEKVSNCLVDNNAPSIYINFSIQSTGEEIKDGKKYKVYPSYTQIYIGATDKYSGTEKIYYSINGGTKQLYVSARDIAQRKLISKEGFYTVKVTALDKLGNESEKTLEFFIKRK